MNNDKNRNGVLRQLASLQTMSRQEVEDKWRDLYGTEPPRFKLSFIRRRLAYRIQELFYGGIEPAVKEKFQELAAKDLMASQLVRPQPTTTPEGKILPGSRFQREWNGKVYEAIALEKGFEYRGKPYRSLTAIATEITGTKWNGQVWWGLKNRKKHRTNRRSGL